MIGLIGRILYDFIKIVWKNKRARYAMFVSFALLWGYSCGSRVGKVGSVRTNDGDRSQPPDTDSIWKRNYRRIRSATNTARAVSKGIRSLAGLPNILRSEPHTDADSEPNPCSGALFRPIHGNLDESGASGWSHNLGVLGGFPEAYGLDIQAYKFVKWPIGLNGGFVYWQGDSFRPIISMSYNLKNLTMNWTKNTEIFLGGTSLGTDGIVFGIRINL
jgi:hypothetical protein